MRKLTQNEELALAVLTRHGSYCPGEQRAPGAYGYFEFLDLLNSLAKKKRVWIEPTDDGPRYHAA